MNSFIQPPIFVYGWVIDRARFCQEARARNLEVYLSSSRDPEDRHSLDVNPRVPHGMAVDGLKSSENYVRTVIEEDLQILDLPVDKYVKVVWGIRPDGKDICPYYAVGLFDNYNIDDRPSKEDEERIRDALGLQGKPGWLAEAMSGPHWYFWDSDPDD